MEATLQAIDDVYMMWRNHPDNTIYPRLPRYKSRRYGHFQHWANLAHDILEVPSLLTQAHHFLDSITKYESRTKLMGMSCNSLHIMQLGVSPLCTNWRNIKTSLRRGPLWPFEVLIKFWLHDPLRFSHDLWGYCRRLKNWPTSSVWLLLNLRSLWKYTFYQ